MVLSLGIPFALIPLVALSGNRSLMGGFANRTPLRIAAWAVVTLIVALNLTLIGLMVTGQG